MKKRILSFVLSAIMLAGAASVWAEENQSVTAVSGAVSVSCTVEAAEGTPVLIFVVPAIMENDVDVTEEKIQELTTDEIFGTLAVEYAMVVKAGTGGLVEHSFSVKDSLPTGLCHVMFSYLGSSGCYSAGSFEHIGQDDVEALVAAFNASTKEGYATLIDEDINGKAGEEPKNILKKSSADTDYYATLTDESAFHDLLFGLKPEDGFDMPSLVSAFNEAKAWLQLRTETDTLAVLSAYNGTGNGKFWNLPLGDDSDFAALSENERTKLLSDLKAAGYSDSALLYDDFIKGVALGMFRGTETREDLESLLAESNAYASYFEAVRKVISDAGLSQYETAELYNQVLQSNSACNSFAEAEELFKKSIPEKSVPGSQSSSGGRRGGGSSFISSVITGSPAETDNQPTVSDGSKTSFSDVSAEHWASSYIERLYAAGVINGVDGVNFAPQGTVSRQDYVKIMIGALGMPLTETASTFSDVEKGAYYEAYVMTAFEKGFISGLEADYFGVGQSIRREDAAVIIARVLEAYNIEMTDEPAIFADEADMADYAREAIKAVSAAGIFGGDDAGNFNAKGSLSRAEACAILCRLADVIKEG